MRQIIAHDTIDYCFSTSAHLFECTDNKTCSKVWKNLLHLFQLTGKLLCLNLVATLSKKIKKKKKKKHFEKSPFFLYLSSFHCKQKKKKSKIQKFTNANVSDNSRRARANVDKECLLAFGGVAGKPASIARARTRGAPLSLTALNAHSRRVTSRPKTKQKNNQKHAHKTSKVYH